MDNQSRIDYVEIPSADLEKTKKFFHELFEWNFKDYGSEYTAFSDGRIEGGFYKSNVVAATSSGSTLVVFYSKDLESSLSRVQELGGSVVKEIFSFPGGKRFQFKDPGGSEFAIWSDQ